MKTKFLISFFLFLSACTPNTSIAVPTNTEKVIDTPATTLTDEPIPPSEQKGSEEQYLDELCKSAGYQGLANFYTNIDDSPTLEWTFASCEDTLENNISYPFIIAHVWGGQTVEPITFPLDQIEVSSPTLYLPEYWNVSENTLIVSGFEVPCQDDILCIYEDGQVLFKIDLENRDVSILLPPKKSAYAFSISLDGKYLVYIDQTTPEILHIQNLVSGEDKSIELKGNFTKSGGFTWVPDSNNELLFFGLSYVDNLPISSLFFVDIANPSVKVLLTHQSGVYFPRPLNMERN